jgi:two-component system phosphate regulon sensor histidine kinase PhoR
MSGEGNASSFMAFDSDGPRKLRRVTAILDDLVDAEFEPIAERLDSINIDSVIAATFEENGIDLAYAYGVLTEPDDSLKLVVPAEYGSEVLESDLRVRLFPDDIFAAPAYLSVYFPDQRVYLWREMGPLLFATVVLMGIITACFAYTIRTILRQRRFSGLMVDFINNMTHEFKTPISTVALATEAISRPDVIAEKDQVRRYSDMIASENRRMQSQTEKILQMAALEENDVELTLVELDIHEILQSAVDSLSLRVQGHGGNIVSRFEATRSSLVADKVHLSSIIHNLLDNADKYSDGPPDITVRTFDSDRGIGVRIEDRGIGLRPEDRKRVFEKYFRVPTGNRHDVKGFGLGLSYVRMMVEAHGGTIELFSRHGEGTQVEIVLPMNPAGDER